MANTKSERTIPKDLLLHLRNIAPKRALRYSEALTVAKLQALRLRKLLDITGPSADLTWVLRLPNVRVKPLGAHEMREIAKGDASGITKRLKNGDYFIGVNKNRSHAHRRFTLAHELKHWLDYPYRTVLYGSLGFGNKETNHKQAERICDHFAAHFLVPDTLLKRAWTSGFQDVTVLAAMFTVSEDTMQIRLRNEGFIDTGLPTESLFRRVGLISELSAA